MVFEKIKEIIIENLEIEESKITLDANLLEDLDADSLDLFQMVSDVEDEFDVKIEDIENIKTIQDVVNAVESQL